MDSRALDEHRLRRMLDVGRALVAELGREALLKRVLELARELTGARYAALDLLATDSTHGARALSSGAEDLILTADADGRDGSAGAILSVPVIVRGNPRGDVHLAYKEPGDFDEADYESLTVLAEWVAIAIEDASLHETARSRREELERAVAALEATTAIARAVGGESDLDSVLHLVVQRGRTLVHARSLLILLPQGEGLGVAAVAGNGDRETAAEPVAAMGSAPREVLRSGSGRRVTGGGHTALLVPLIFRTRTVGVLVALDRVVGGPEFGEDDERLMRSFAASAATAVAATQSVEAERLRRSIDAAERERSRWARELHDETLQGLGALQVMLTTEGAAGRAVRQLEAEIEKLQSLITELRPAALDDIGLAPALMSLFDRTESLHGLSVEAAVDLGYEEKLQPTRLEADVESTIYRLVQEGLTNIVKHAHARHARVRVAEADGRVGVEVADDGRGFDPTVANGGFGLVGMRERVDLVGGTLEIDSAPGAATVIRAELPAPHRDPVG